MECDESEDRTENGKGFRVKMANLTLPKVNLRWLAEGLLVVISKFEVRNSRCQTYLALAGRKYQRALLFWFYLRFFCGKP
jgi:hypothetical protein